MTQDSVPLKSSPDRSRLGVPAGLVLFGLIAALGLIWAKWIALGCGTEFLLV
jgi:hypothetical protein